MKAPRSLPASLKTRRRRSVGVAPDRSQDSLGGAIPRRLGGVGGYLLDPWMPAPAAEGNDITENVDGMLRSGDGVVAENLPRTRDVDELLISRFVAEPGERGIELSIAHPSAAQKPFIHRYDGRRARPSTGAQHTSRRDLRSPGICPRPRQSTVPARQSPSRPKPSSIRYGRMCKAIVTRGRADFPARGAEVASCHVCGCGTSGRLLVNRP